MADESLDGMPEFETPKEHIPLVVPDEPIKKYCKGTKKDGSPCTIRVRDFEYCPPHDPNITEEQRQQWRSLGGQATADVPKMRGPKSPDEMLEIFSKRIAVFLSKCSEDTASAEELLVFCHISKAYATLYDRTEASKKDAEDGKPQGWRMKGAV